MKPLKINPGKKAPDSLGKDPDNVVSRSDVVWFAAERLDRSPDRSTRDRIGKQISRAVQAEELAYAVKYKFRLGEIGRWLTIKYPNKFADLPADPSRIAAAGSIGRVKTTGSLQEVRLPDTIPACHAEIMRLMESINNLRQELARHEKAGKKDREDAVRYREIRMTNRMNGAKSKTKQRHFR